MIQEFWWGILKEFGGVVRVLVGGNTRGVRGDVVGISGGYGSAEIVVGYVEMGEIVVVMGKNKVVLG